MGKKNSFTRVLAIVGTVLVAFPVLAPVFISIFQLIQVGAFHFDFLMPAELFLFALLGGLLLVWAALRARLRRGLIAVSLASAAGLLVGSQALAVATGLATGEREAAGFWFVLVLAGIIGYSLALIAIIVGGILLLRGLYSAKPTGMA